MNGIFLNKLGIGKDLTFIKITSEGKLTLDKCKIKLEEANFIFIFSRDSKIIISRLGITHLKRNTTILEASNS